MDVGDQLSQEYDDVSEDAVVSGWNAFDYLFVCACVYVCARVRACV